MLVLAIDTSSPAVTAGVVSVGDELSVVCERSPIAARGHGELLAPAIADCLTSAGIGAADLDAVVAGVGPGPYTGLRVGLVSAAAIADVVGAPTYGVCSLDAIAGQASAGTGDGRLLVATDARRREVYWARYDARGARLDGPHVDRPAEVELDDAGAVAGAGAQLYPDAWARAPRVAVWYPSVLALVALARERVVTAAPSEPLTPMYLRRPDAVAPGAAKTVLQ